MESSGEKRSWLPWVLLVAVIVLVVTVFLLRRDATPPLTREKLEKAEGVWREQGLSSYSVTVLKEADTLQPERFVTRVENGKVTELLLNGRPLEAKDTYTVQGLFDTIHREMEMASQQVPKEGQPREAVLKAFFHEELGLPLVFKRLAPNRRSFFLAIEELSDPQRGVLYSSSGK